MQTWPHSESPVHPLGRTEIYLLITSTHPLAYKFPPWQANTHLHFPVTSRLCQRRQWHPTPVLLPGKSHGRRSLVGCSPWDHKQLGTTEQLHFHFLLSCTEGNGNPLQCSCLENPRDRGTWWAAVYGSHRVEHDWSDLAAAAAAGFVHPTESAIFLHNSRAMQKSHWEDPGCWECVLALGWPAWWGQALSPTCLSYPSVFKGGHPLRPRSQRTWLICF